jgi:FtsH-binding integral membrane protein
MPFRLQPQPVAYRRVGSGEISLEQSRVLRNTYLLLALTMVPTVIGAWVGMATGGIILKHPVLSFLVLFAAVIGLQFAIAAHRDSGLGVVLLLAMTLLLGWWLGPLLSAALSLRNGPQLVGYAAAGTGIVFFSMAAIATTARRDFSFMGKFLFVGMIVLLVALVANMFLQIPALALAISSLVVVLFSLFLLHDISRIVHGGETNYIIAATGCYLSLFNIFANLLQLLLALAGERE